MPLCGVYELYLTGISSAVALMAAQAYTKVCEACKKIERFAKIVNG